MVLEIARMPLHLSEESWYQAADLLLSLQEESFDLVGMCYFKRIVSNCKQIVDYAATDEWP